MARKRATRNYVNNKDLLAALIAYREAVAEAEEGGEDKPVVPDYIGKCIMMIAQRLATRPNFSGYMYKEEMISDGIENCLQYIHNFDPDKSKNPFSYFTQIIYYAFLRRIQKEKKQSHIKNKMIEKHQYEQYTTLDNDDTVYCIDGFDPTIMLPDEDVYKPKTKEPQEKTDGLENFMEKEDDKDTQ